jgi:hypothetical protein
MVEFVERRHMMCEAACRATYVAEGIAAGTEKAQAAKDALLEGLHGRVRAARRAPGTLQSSG